LGADVAIDVLINNAQGESPLYSKKVNQGGVAERATTEDGFDRIIGTAHLGHFAVVAALLPALKRSRRAACLMRRLGCTNAASGLYRRSLPPPPGWWPRRAAALAN